MPIQNVAMTMRGKQHAFPCVQQLEAAISTM